MRLVLAVSAEVTAGRRHRRRRLGRGLHPSHCLQPPIRQFCPPYFLFHDFCCCGILVHTAPPLFLSCSRITKRAWLRGRNRMARRSSLSNGWTTTWISKSWLMQIGSVSPFSTLIQTAVTLNFLVLYEPLRGSGAIPGSESLVICLTGYQKDMCEYIT
ncbi:hypothetical protein EJB05_04722, partial [Eragrostis curvula]